MEPSKRSIPPDDEIERTLRAAARRKRRGSLVVLFLVMLFLLGPLALFVWWTWPEGEPPRLAIVAADQLAIPGEETNLSAFLAPAEPATTKPRLSGYEISFEETAPAGKNRRQGQEVRSDVDGKAAATWHCPEKSGAVDIIARYRGDKKRPGAEDRARLYVWPADAPLLLVDVPAVVSPLPAASWQAKNIPDIPLRAEANKALQAAEAKKYRIVYVAIEPADAISYRKCRWIINKALPSGPVLSRSNYERDAASEWEEIVKDIKQRFRGPVLAVLGNNEIAAACRSVGIRAAALGDAADLQKLIDLLDKK